MHENQFLPQVLLVEDDIPTIALYQRELASSYKIFPCHDEASVLHHLKAHDIDLVILEPAFMGVDGWNLLTTIKEAAFSSSIPIIVCTTQDACLRAKQLGAIRCLVKPVLPITLQRLLDELVREITNH